MLLLDQQIDILAIRKRLKPNQLVWARVAHVSDAQHKYSIMYGDVRNFSFSLTSSDYQIGDVMWVRIKQPVTSSVRQTTIVEPYIADPATPPAMIQEGDICFGRIRKISDESMKVNVTPKMIVDVTNFHEVFQGKLPREKDPITVQIDNLQQKPYTAHIVYHTAKSPSTSENTAKQSPKQEDQTKKTSYATSRIVQQVEMLPKAILPDDLTIHTGLGTFPDESGNIINATRDKDRELAANIVSKSYDIAVDRGFVLVDSMDYDAKTIAFSFPICTTMGKGSPYMFFGVRSDVKNPGKWFVELAGYKGKNSAKAFTSQVFVKSMDELLQQLADTALPEQWSFDDTKAKYDILDNYLKITYFNAWIRELLVDAEDPDKHYVYRIFNTGLVNYRYESIYGVFRKYHNYINPMQKWKYEGFAVVGDSQTDLGKTINRLFPYSQLPKRIQYISELADLYLDRNTPITTDYTHIVVDNITRLPPKFFLYTASYLYANDVKEIVDQMESSNHAVRTKAYQRMKEYISKNDAYRASLEKRIQDAEHQARMRAEWNYKAAVPMYFASKNCISLLLPLSLTHEGKPGAAASPDVALAVSRLSSGNYQGESIYTLQQAYLASRLITRPDSDWLMPDAIRNAAVNNNQGE